MFFLVSFFSKIMVVENEDLVKIVTSCFSKQPQSVNFDIYSISGQRIVTCTREDDSIREHYEVQFIQSHWTTRWKTRKKDLLCGPFFSYRPSELVHALPAKALLCAQNVWTKVSICTPIV